MNAKKLKTISNVYNLDDIRTIELKIPKSYLFKQNLEQLIAYYDGELTSDTVDVILSTVRSQRKKSKQS